MKADNLTQVIALLIKKLQIPVTVRSIEEEMAKHPEYNSMLAISELLDNWRIPNAAYQLSFDELLAAEVEGPFVVYYANKDFALVTRINNQTVTLLESRQKKEKTITVEKFKELYGGAILLAEKAEDSGENDYRVKRRQAIFVNLRIPLIITGLLLVVISLLINHTNYFATINVLLVFLALFKTAGLAVSVLLLMQSIDTNNPLIQVLCGGDNSKNCNAILSSNAAKITNFLSWSEVGFFYFAGSWLLLLFSNNNTSLIQLLAILNLISLPYTFYSIYYQWRIAKQWCIYCCTIQGLLWAEFFAFIPNLPTDVSFFNSNSAISLLTTFAIPVLFWIFIKPFLLQAEQIDPLKQQLRKFKYNTNLFNKLINDEVKFATLKDEDSIIIGDPEAEHIITMVSNPYCQPCAKAHKALDGWLANRNDVKLQIIFSVSDPQNDPRAKVAEHLFALQANTDGVTLKKAVDDWYNQQERDFDKWSTSHPSNVKIAVSKILEKQQEWCNVAEINATPTIFINGRRLPGNYQPEDIKYFI